MCSWYRHVTSETYDLGWAASDFWATVCKTVCPMLSYHCLSSLSVCNVGVLWLNGWMDQDETWYGRMPWPWLHCVRWGPSSPKKGHSPHFSAHIYCGQTAGWIKMPLGTKVGLGPGHIVLDGDPDSQKGHSPPPIFGLCLLWPKGRSSQLLLSNCSLSRGLDCAESNVLVPKLDIRSQGKANVTAIRSNPAVAHVSFGFVILCHTVAEQKIWRSTVFRELYHNIV